MGGVFTVRLGLDLLAFPYDENAIWIDDRAGLVDDWPDWDDQKVDGSGRVDVVMRTTDDDPVSPNAIWNAWEPFATGAIETRGIEFAAVLSALPNENVAVEELCVLVDLRRKIDELSDVVYAAAIKHVDFNIKFFRIPSVTITIQEASAGDHIIITNKGTTGFDIEIRDAAGNAAINRTFDVVAAGY
jgi:hypothetical protein